MNASTLGPFVPFWAQGSQIVIFVEVKAQLGSARFKGSSWVQFPRVGPGFNPGVGRVGRGLSGGPRGVQWARGKERNVQARKREKRGAMRR